MSDQNAKLIASSRNPGSMSDLYTGSDIPDRYEDGVGQMMMGPAVTKISFFSIKELSQDDAGNNVEQRFIDLKLTMPTTALIQWAAGILTTVAASREAMTAASKSTEAAIDGAIKQISEAAAKQAR